MSGIFNIEQITQGKTLDDWYKPANHQEDQRMSNRSEIRAALQHGRLSRTALKDMFKKMANVDAALSQMTKEGQLTRTGEGDEAFFELAHSPSATAPKANGSKKPKAAAKPFKFKHATRTPPPKAKAQPPAPASCNVADFTPALTADRRLVIIGGTEPLIFSPEQTRNIATLMANFGA